MSVSLIPAITVAAWVICGLIAWLENIVDWELRCFHFQWRRDLAMIPHCVALGPIALLINRSHRD
jgi:hypothetical protein